MIPLSGGGVGRSGHIITYSGVDFQVLHFVSVAHRGSAHYCYMAMAVPGPYWVCTDALAEMGKECLLAALLVASTDSQGSGVLITIRWKWMS